MGNQVSKVVAEKQKRSDKRVKKDNSRRRSTISLGTSGDQSTSSLTTANTTSANYEWLEQQRVEEKPTLINPRRKSVTEFFMKRKQSLKSIINQDEFREIDRLQRQHYLLKSARKTNFWAPINPNAELILDVGCGNGIWALEVAQQFPNAQVTGIDLSPPNEQQSNPKNLSYQRADMFEGLKFSDASVDYIFMRSMGLVIKDDKWASVLKEFLRVLKPGGMVELFEADLIHHNPGPVLHAFDGFFSSQCDEMGLDFTFTERLHERIQNCGFVDVSRRTLDIPLGEWPTDTELKQFGFINKETNKSLFKTMKNFYVVQWGITTDDYDLAVQEALEEFDEYHGFTRFNVFIAQKPV
ncbi:S-adenosyl-L-methionine-dependent methyltransferase [Endogone sp. FLAS-F59071]|nr:S-adenosyl-L-methionine-dependent methyltransferase [Endogone sp. FLAS-F59071]|eukprot:RUS17233.1 S-adenosyl-L-methionine-dependent methyltransferase [Endogone sp. FLAS-F59071]